MKKLIILTFIIVFTATTMIFASESDIAIIKPVGEPSESGYQAYGMFDIEGNEVIPAERGPQVSLFSLLPEKYDSRDYGYISPVKNQGTFGTCWTHAFVACAEANMIKKGYEEYFNNYSELHLAYFYHKRNEAQGDGIDNLHPDYGYFGGGNGQYAAQFAENFQALAVESDFPYSMISNSTDFRIDEKYRNHADVHMVDYGKLIDAEDAKKAIMRYGAISLGYYEDFDSVSDHNAYYQNYSSKTNHEVAVVGWDDNFPVEKFNANCRPSNPGAWLIKNSYGKAHRDFGYFWLSYEDPSIELGCYYEFEPIGDEAKVHTYNGGIANITWIIPKAANIFRAEEDQTVYAVSFDSATYNVVPEEYEVNIYISDSKPSNPESGTLRATLTGAIKHDGFHHIELDTPIQLKANQYLSVVVGQSNSRGQSAASLFEAGDAFTSREGESWAFTNGAWENMYNFTLDGYKIKNSTIKAYYKTNTATVHFNTREAEHFDTQTVNIGECVTKPDDPIKEGFEFLGWYTNNTVTDEWDFSTPVTHDMRLFAKWSEPENVDMKVRSRYFSTKDFYPSITVSANNITDFKFYFLKDGKYNSQSASFLPDRLNGWISYGFNPGNYGTLTEIHGINGEEIITDIENFTVTDNPALSVREGFIHMVNLPSRGADLYVAQYDDEGRFLSIKKTSHYPGQSNGKTVYTKIINAPTNYQNPKYFLWALGETTPLCENE